MGVYIDTTANWILSDMNIDTTVDCILLGVYIDQEPDISSGWNRNTTFPAQQKVQVYTCSIGESDPPLDPRILTKV